MLVRQSATSDVRKIIHIDIITAESTYSGLRVSRKQYLQASLYTNTTEALLAGQTSVMLMLR